MSMIRIKIFSAHAGGTRYGKMHLPPGWTILFQGVFHRTDRALGMMLMVLVLANTDAVVRTTARLISVKLEKQELVEICGCPLFLSTII